MAELDKRYAPGTTIGRAEAIDQGLRSYMLRVYNYMGIGVAITGVVAYLVFAMSVVQGADGAISGAHPLRQLHVCQRLQMGGDLRAPRAGILHLRPHQHDERRRARNSTFWLYRGADGRVAGFDLPGLYRRQHRRRCSSSPPATFGGLEPLGLHHASAT